MMRTDSQLVFLKVCGPPTDDDEISAKPMNKNVDMDNDDSKLDDDEDSVLSGSKTPSERGSSLKPGKDASDKNNDNSADVNGQFKPFPSVSELNGRLRRLMAAYQRENKREEARLAAQDRRNERRERIEQVIREREAQKIDLNNKKLTRKEENDFYRAIMAYGIEKNKKGNTIVWDRFKALARLDKKYDDTLTEFYKAFIGACKKATGQKLTEEEKESCKNLQIEAIDENKAKKILARVELIRVIREEVLDHAKLDERMLLCEPACDLPNWWISGKHDKDLLQGVARHGMARMDYSLLNDPDLSFKDILKRHVCSEPLVDKKAVAEYEKARAKAKSDAKPSDEDADLEETKSTKDDAEEKVKEKEANDENDEKKADDDEDDDETKDGKKADDSKENTDKEEDAEPAASPKKKTPEKKASPEKKVASNARRASVSVAPPQITMQQMEQMAKGGLIYDMDMMNDLMAQTYASAVKWPKDQILAIRVEHIVQCIQDGKYPVEDGHSLGEILAELQDNDNSPFDSKSHDSNLRDTSTPLSEASDKGHRYSKDANNEQSKIRQLLTSGLASKVDEEEDPIAR